VATVDTGNSTKFRKKEGPKRIFKDQIIVSLSSKAGIWKNKFITWY